MKKPKKYPTFESYFVDCVIKGVNCWNCPDSYVWDINKPGIWLDRYKEGMSPLDAVEAEFIWHHEWKPPATFSPDVHGSLIN